MKATEKKVTRDGMGPWVPEAAAKWQERLDKARQTGDAHADEAVEEVLGQLSVGDRKEQIKSLLTLLTQYDFPLQGGHGSKPDLEVLAALYDAIDHRMDPRRRFIGSDPAQMTAAYEKMREIFFEERFVVGRWVFSRNLLSCAMILACYSLPAAYSAHKGVRVLAGTGFLEIDPNRRLHETTKLVFLLMAPGGKTPEEQSKAFFNAFLALRKIRVLHALVRRMLLDSGRWDVETLGVPINQEDLAATLMTFSYLIIDGMRMMDQAIDPRGEQAYLDAWAYAGVFLGVEEDLIPANVGKAEILTKVIQWRQCDPNVANPDGVAMTAALVKYLEGEAPWILRRFPAAMMRYFLPDDVADALQIPKRRILAHMLPWLMFAEQHFDGFRLFHRLGREIYELVDRSAQRAGRPFHGIAFEVAEKFGLVGSPAVIEPGFQKEVDRVRDGAERETNGEKEERARREDGGDRPA